jgi:hypothetical protein
MTVGRIIANKVESFNLFTICVLLLLSMFVIEVVVDEKEVKVTGIGFELFIKELYSVAAISIDVFVVGLAPKSKAFTRKIELILKIFIVSFFFSSKFNKNFEDILLEIYFQWKLISSFFSK